MFEQKNVKMIDDSDIQIELHRFIRIIWKNLWIILIIAMLGGTTVYLGTKYFVSPTYKSEFTAYVNNRSGTTSDIISSLTSSDLSASQDLVETYAGILKSKSVLENAAKRAGLSYEYNELVQFIQTDTLDDTEIMKVTIITPNADDSYKLAYAITQIAPEKIASIVEGSSMRVIDEPAVATTRHEPNFTKKVLFGFVAGFFLSLIVIVILDIFNDRVTSEKELEERIKIHVIGVIPEVTLKNRR